VQRVLVGDMINPPAALQASAHGDGVGVDFVAELRRNRHVELCGGLLVAFDLADANIGDRPLRDLFGQHLIGEELIVRGRRLAVGQGFRGVAAAQRF